MNTLSLICSSMLFVSDGTLDSTLDSLDNSPTSPMATSTGLYPKHKQQPQQLMMAPPVLHSPEHLAHYPDDDESEYSEAPPVLDRYDVVGAGAGVDEMGEESDRLMHGYYSHNPPAASSLYPQQPQRRRIPRANDYPASDNDELEY